MNKIFQYLKDVRTELSKITWPKKEEVIKLTLIVFIFSALVAFYVGGLDLIFTNVLGKIISR
ncbi:preprotein translocase subunit SecE [Candidatus Woesebacteria bacterium RBG_16_36_11]|uniref:Protein translocase subunit SecE n=1 Tax=Candidatus Woesebacteria bacterium RBG_16_36_11 TaxID=1802481 RepID=A0A1F7XAE7_9BACT|nr:MAG: preprotein translocase subunit SecE [Candidatus Woesebacteria bacterium RBG_16_36_11]